MEYKVCENCNEKLHVRTQKCPFCNTVLTEKSQIIKEIEEVIQEPKKDDFLINTVNETKQENVNEEAPNVNEEIKKNNLPDREVKDYVYKAEVRHSLEYTKLMPNGLKVFLTAISMIPIIGQIIGTFFGVFFLTYDDNDRKSFGRSLICLAIIMFCIYAYNLMIFTELLESSELNTLLQDI